MIAVVPSVSLHRTCMLMESTAGSGLTNTPSTTSPDATSGRGGCAALVSNRGGGCMYVAASTVLGDTNRLCWSSVPVPVSARIWLPPPLTISAMSSLFGAASTIGWASSVPMLNWVLSSSVFEVSLAPPLAS